MSKLLEFYNIDKSLPTFKSNYKDKFVLDENNDLYLGVDDGWKKFLSADDILENTLNSTSTTKALSSKMGKELNDRLTNIENLYMNLLVEDISGTSEGTSTSESIETLINNIIG